jgi:hypothetical protein
VRAELFHADGRTDMTKMIAAFHNFANAPEKGRENMIIVFNIQAGLRHSVCIISQTQSIINNLIN